VEYFCQRHCRSVCPIISGRNSNQALGERFFWGEHWALRVVASWAAAIGAGYLAGLAARRRGRIIALISALPVTLCWLVMTIFVWRDQWFFFPKDTEIQVSIGNKLAASLLVLTILPFTAWAGSLGEQDGQTHGTHFDARRFSLLGIKWYHYLWLPFVVYLWLVQASWAVFFGFEWLKASWKSSFSLSSFVPVAFTFMIWSTLALMWKGAAKAYVVLSGLELLPTARERAYSVLRNGVGLLILAALLQFGIQLLALGLAKLFGSH
jgi:hypothetical protein